MKNLVLVGLVLCIVGMPIIAGPQPDVDTEAAPEAVLSTIGPAGNKPVSYDTIVLSDDQKTKVRGMGLKAAILMHVSADFTNSLTMGARETFEDLGIEVVLVTEAGFDANQQRSDIESAAVLEVDIIVTLIVDAVSGAAALRPVIESGTSIVLISNLPKDFVHGQDYASVVTDDLFGMGKLVADLMNSKMNGRGKVALLYHDADYYVTNQRDQAVATVLRSKYPGIEILKETGIANPSDGETIASAILTQHPEVQAIYAPWDQIAEGVIAAARSSNRSDLMVFTMDLGETNALDMAKNGNLVGTVADLPYELGATAAKIGALDALDQKTPPFVTVPATSVTRENLKTKWQESLRRPLPEEVDRALNR